MQFLTEKTFIPIGTAIAVIGGGAIWLTKISIEQTAHSERLFKIEQKIDAESQYFQEIRERLVRIEVMIDKQKKEN